jgi:hypothetical protein
MTGDDFESMMEHWKGGQGSQKVDKQVYISWKVVKSTCGKAYLSMDVATESKMTDTEGSTATGSPL